MHFQNDPANAPLVIWLQGGPGGSSLFGLLELHGPFLIHSDVDGDLNVYENPYSWNINHNMIYIDNPVGAGKVWKVNWSKTAFFEFIHSLVIADCWICYQVSHTVMFCQQANKM